MKRTHGFTLIELAIVLLIVGLLLAGLLGPLSTRVESEERQKTQAMLEDIKEALYGFAMANGRLPCPDEFDDGDPGTTGDGDGLEDPAGGGCSASAVEGNLPWVTLGVEQQDSWGQNYRYRVTGTFADNIPPAATPPCPAPAGGVSFSLCSDGDIDVCDRHPTGANCSGAGATSVATDVPAVILSYGSNRSDPALAINGDLSTHEYENSHGVTTVDTADDTPSDTTFVMKPFSREDAQEFDDLVVWISPNILKNRMVMANKLP